AFTDNGERLGRVGYPPLVVSWTVTSAVLPDWTGSLRITDHLGAVSHHANVGAGYTLALEQAPVYVEAE
ncbi:MAG: hypothetical protein ACE5EL_02875, partial [Anaerolineae bacterium]